MRRRAVFWVVAAGAVLVAALWLRSGEHGEIREGLETLAQGMGDGPDAAGRAVESWADARVRLTLPASTEGLTRDKLALRAEQYAREHERVVITVTGLDVRVRNGRASASGLLVISDSQVGDLHAEERPFAVELTRRDTWRIASLRIGVARKHLPEARP